MIHSNIGDTYHAKAACGHAPLASRYPTEASPGHVASNNPALVTCPECMGRDAAHAEEHLSAATLTELRGSPEFWKVFHDARPAAVAAAGRCLLEDPTHGGGWCVVPPA